MRIPRSLLAIGLCAHAAFAQGRRPTGTLIVSNMNDNTATLIDAGTGRVLATLATGEGPHEVTASSDGRWALVSNYGVRGKPGSTISVIDVDKREVTRTIDLKEYQRPHGMKFLPGDTLVAVTSELKQSVVLVDFRTGTVVKALPTKGRTSHMLALSSNGERLAVANIADHSFTLIPLSSGEARVVPVAKQPEGIAITPDGNFVWTGSNADGIVLVVDTRTGVATDTLRGFRLPYRLAISSDGRRAVITDPASGTIRAFDVTTRKQLFNIDVPRDSIVEKPEFPGSPSPEGVIISPDGRWAFVTLQGRNRVVTIDMESGKITGWAPTGVWSDGIAYSRLVPRG